MSLSDRTTANDGDGSLIRLFEIWSRKTLLAANAHRPGTVVAPGFNAATQTVSVTVDYLEIERVTSPPGADANNLTSPRAPLLLPAVPVIFAGDGSGLGYLSWPILPGATGTLLIFDRDLATWLTRGAPLPVDPVFSHLHPLHACAWLPGLLPDANRITPPPSQLAAVIEYPQIYLGKESLPLTSVAIAERVVDGVSAVLQSAIATLTPVVAPVTGVQVAAALSTALGVWQGLAPTLASSKVKVAP